MATYTGKKLSITANGDTYILDPANSVLTLVSFEIAVSDWTLVNGVYVATVFSEFITPTSRDLVIFNSSLKAAGVDDISYGKGSAENTYMFVVNTLPQATISGQIWVFMNDNGRVAILTTQDKVDPSMLPWWSVNSSGQMCITYQKEVDD